MTAWTPVPLPPDHDAWATHYGFVIDHIWSNPGVNVARRPHWPEDMWISVQPCDDLDEECEANGNVGARYWVFFDNGLEFAPTAPRLRKQPTSLADLLVLEFEVDEIVPDTMATDWLVGMV